MVDDTHNVTSGGSLDASDPDEERAVTFGRVEQLLRDGTISTTRGMMRWGSNYAALLSIEDGDLAATAVYKPQRGERPLWDFPDGTLCYREVAAYEVSQLLDWALVPPTVLREGPHGIGSLQLFIDHNPEITYFSLDEGFVPQLRRFTIFDYLINNADRKGGHLLLDASGKLWGIDHGLSFHVMPKLRSVIWDFAGQPVEEDLLRAVRRALQQISDRHSAAHERLASLLSEAEIAALVRRATHLLDCQTFPQPGPGPNYPWPPV